MALAAHPAWKDLWYDEPTRQCGRPMRYYQQPQALDVEGAWREVSVPTLIVWGEYDGFVYGDAKQAFDEKGGRFDEGAAKVLSDWLRAH